jgi:cation diffusion facilitator CzcD-associated flavoprotein CzcO
MRFPLSPPPFSFSFPKGIIDVVVVGGGISGLVTAQALLTDHADTVGR